VLERNPVVSHPIRGIFVGCCASAGKREARSREHRAKSMIFLVIDFLPAV
jgi:hypothetical protein